MWFYPELDGRNYEIEQMMDYLVLLTLWADSAENYLIFLPENRL